MPHKLTKTEQEFLDLAPKDKTFLFEHKRFPLSNGTKIVPDFYCPEEDTWYEILGSKSRFYQSAAKRQMFVSEYPELQYKAIIMFKDKVGQPHSIAVCPNCGFQLSLRKMAAEMGREGGKVSSDAKKAAARAREERKRMGK